MPTKKITDLPIVAGTDPIPLVDTRMVNRQALPRQINQSELNRLLKQLYHLREALKPFARFAAALPDMSPPGQPPRLTDVGPAIAAKNPRNPTGEEHVVTFADFRHAKMLVDQLEAEGFERFLAQTERQILGIPDNCAARDCFRPIEGTEPWHCAGFCSRACEARTAAMLRSDY